MTAETADPWESATFAGLQAVQRRKVAAWTPAERWAWVSEAVDLAAANGALARALAAKQRALDELWAAVSSG